MLVQNIGKTRVFQKQTIKKTWLKCQTHQDQFITMRHKCQGWTTMLYLYRDKREDKQDESIDLPQPMAHSFLVSLHPNRTNSFIKIVEPNWRPIAWLPLVLLLSLSDTEALNIYIYIQGNGQITDIDFHMTICRVLTIQVLQGHVKKNVSPYYLWESCRSFQSFNNRLDSFREHETRPIFVEMLF